MKEKIKILSMWCCAIFFAAEFAIARPLKTSLAPGRWDPRVKAALEELTVEHGKGSDHNDPRKPPLAVLPWDKVFMINDLGDAVFQSMVQRVQFKFDDEFWSIIPIGYGRRRTQAAYEQFVGHPQRAWERQPTYQQYRKFFVVGYRQMCDKAGRKECRSYLTKLLRGFSEEEVAAYAKNVLKQEAGLPLGQDLLHESPEDEEAVWIARGLRLVPEMLDLARLLLDAGFEVWISDMEPQPVLEAAIEACGLKPARAAGIQQSPLRGKLSGKVTEPVPIRGGKTEAIVSKTGREPLLALGGSSDDLDLMNYGSGVRVWLDRGDSELAQAAQEKGWLIQTSFIQD